MGVRERLLESYPGLKTIAVEPAESAVMSGGKPGAHKIQGIGDGFIPELVKMECIDEVKAIKSDDAIYWAKLLARDFNLRVGISSGANILAAIEASKEYEVVVTILPDSSDRYKSLGL